MQDIAAGRGVGVIDPHGDLARELLDCISGRRADDLVYFNPTDHDHPVGVNLLKAATGPDDRHLMASGIASALKSIWRDSWGPRLEYLLYATISSLAECQNVSLLGVQRMLIAPLYRGWVLRQVKDPLLLSFWEDEFARYDRCLMAEILLPIQNKVGRLLLAPVIRNVPGQVSSRIDFRFMMD